VAAAEAAGMETNQLKRRTVEIRGRTKPIEVIVLPRLDRKVSPGSTGSSWRLGRCGWTSRVSPTQGSSRMKNGLHLYAKDPDNIALEFFYMPPQG
jgi:hypothetical protein